MILLDSDVMIDLLRHYQPAVAWFNNLGDEEEIILPGYVMMELIQGCRNKKELGTLQRELTGYGLAWPLPEDCNIALGIFTQYRLSHNAGLLDVLIGQTAVALDASLYTFNQRHYQFVPGLRTVQPYKRNDADQ